jgi:hypothetical protein
MPTDLSQTNTWLGVIAIASLVQVLALAGLSIYAIRLMTRARAALDTVEREVAPMTARAQAVLDDLHDIGVRVKHADDAVRATVQGVNRSLRYAREAALWKLWPVFGVARAAKAITSALGRRASRATPVPGAAIDQARFVYEGGPAHANDTAY